MFPSPQKAQNCADATTPQPQREGEIPLELNRLGHTINLLITDFETLAKRLDPILRFEQPKQTTTSDKQVTESSTSPLGHLLSTYNNNLKSLHESLLITSNRLEM